MTNRKYCAFVRNGIVCPEKYHSTMRHWWIIVKNFKHTFVNKPRSVKLQPAISLSRDCSATLPKGLLLVANHEGLTSHATLRIGGKFIRLAHYWNENRTLFERIKHLQNYQNAVWKVRIFIVLYFSGEILVRYITFLRKKSFNTRRFAAEVFFFCFKRFVQMWVMIIIIIIILFPGTWADSARFCFSV